MSNGDVIWRQRVWVWLPALLFFLANAAAFSVYRLGYAGDVRSLERDLEKRNQELAPLRKQRTELEQLIGRAQTSREQVTALYADRFSTRSRRLTGITAEVKSMAQNAGLEPREFIYPEEEIEDYGLVKRSFVFTVQGSYAELRRFIALLEKSPSFLTLEGASLSGQSEGGQELQISLTLSTLFAKEPVQSAVGAAVSGGAGGAGPLAARPAERPGSDS